MPTSGEEHPGGPKSEAIAIVRRYLDAMEARRLDDATALLGAGFVMTFPGNTRLTSLDELIAWARPRYRFVAKSYERFDAAADDDAVIVYCFGTLSGEWPDSTAFAGIRFIDRFALEAGRIVRQDVWNDLAEVRSGP